MSLDAELRAAVRSGDVVTAARLGLRAGRPVRVRTKATIAQQHVGTVTEVRINEAGWWPLIVLCEPPEGLPGIPCFLRFGPAEVELCP